MDENLPVEHDWQAVRPSVDENFPDGHVSHTVLVVAVPVPATTPWPAGHVLGAIDPLVTPTNISVLEAVLDIQVPRKGSLS